MKKNSIPSRIYYFYNILFQNKQYLREVHEFVSNNFGFYMNFIISGFLFQNQILLRKYIYCQTFSLYSYVISKYENKKYSYVIHTVVPIINKQTNWYQLVPMEKFSKSCFLF